MQVYIESLVHVQLVPNHYTHIFCNCLNYVVVVLLYAAMLFIVFCSFVCHLQEALVVTLSVLRPLIARAGTKTPK